MFNTAENLKGGKFFSSKKYDRIDERKIPAFPKTPHLPHNPIVTGNDIIASSGESNIIFEKKCYLEEKIDGSSVGIRLEDGHFAVRNRNNILSKGYTKKNTPAKCQFRPIWNWTEENREKFEKLEELLGFTPTVYGEWMYAKHTIYYDLLPSLFIAYDIYDCETDRFLSPSLYRGLFETVGLSRPAVLSFEECQLSNYSQIDSHLDRMSFYSSCSKMEGVYIKVVNDKNDTIISRFKIVRPDFSPDKDWNEKELTKNRIIKV